MKTTSKTKKTVKPAFVVDMTYCTSIHSLKNEIIRAKTRGGIAISEDDLMFIENDALLAGFELNELTNKLADVFNNAFDVISDTLSKMDECDGKCENCAKEDEPKAEKKPWYKRLWNWIRRK